MSRDIRRREFLILAAAALAGRETVAKTASAERIVDAAKELLALSALCTHRKCKLSSEPDRSFYCKCHGSAFDPNGKVTEGPAQRDLPILSTVND